MLGGSDSEEIVAENWRLSIDDQDIQSYNWTRSFTYFNTYVNSDAVTQ